MPLPNPSFHPSQILLRPYEEADLPTLYALDQVCFPPGIAYAQEELREFAEHPSSQTAIAVSSENSDSILGFALVRTARRRLSTSRGLWTPVLHLITIDVSPESRRLGIGNLLMEWILRQARDRKLVSVVLEVAVNNDAAREFYKRWGFRETGIIPGYYSDTLDAVSMERDTAAL